MGNLIQVKLRIKTSQEVLFSLLEVKAQLYRFFETEGCVLNDILLAVYTI